MGPSISHFSDDSEFDSQTSNYNEEDSLTNIIRMHNKINKRKTKKVEDMQHQIEELEKDPQFI